MTNPQKDIQSLFFELIRVAIGTQDSLSRIPTEREWGMLFRMAQKQSLVGICFAAIERLRGDDCIINKSSLDREDLGGSSIPHPVYLRWLGITAKIQQRNEVLNKQCVDLQNRLAEDGFRSYIMKGQANAALYGELATYRQSGDIDIYLEGGLQKVLQYARTLGETSHVNELEMTVKIYPDTDVEFHYRPMVLRDPFKNTRLQRFFDENSAIQFRNSLLLDKEKGLQIIAPTNAFNLVHQLVHIYLHFITGGIGLRQLMDYYFVLKACQVDDQLEGLQVIHRIGLDRFAGGLSWTLHYVFALPRGYCYWPINEEDGRALLDEIMISGNFGHTDERMADIATNKWTSFWFVNGKTFGFWRFDRWAWFWSPLWRIYHFCWRKVTGLS